MLTTTEEVLALNDLPRAIGSLSEQLRDSPGDQRLRTFLFELLCFSGDLDRAALQLDVLAQTSADRDAAVQRYRNVLAAEKRRRQLFESGGLPGLPKSVPPFVHLHLEALGHLRDGEPEAALAALEQAADQETDVCGEINGTPFDNLRDGDDRFGPILEVFTAGNYSWLPFEAIRSVTIAEPTYLRDLIFLPAEIELTIGPLGEAYIPVLYPGSHEHADDRVKLGRMTTWTYEADDQLAFGFGQRLLSTSDREWPILEVRSIEIGG